MISKFPGLFLALLLVISITTHVSAQDILIKDAWVASIPPSEDVTAAFMTIENSSDQEKKLVAASTSWAQVTEIHHMSRKNGMMQMAMLKELPIPAKGSVVLEPGSYHLMLIQLKNKLTQQEKVDLTLQFSDGSSLDIEAPVRNHE